MRLFIRFLLAPFPRGDGADNYLAAGMNVDMLHRDLLLPFAAVTLERLDLSSEGAQQLHCEVSAQRVDAFGTASVSRPSAGATASLLSAISSHLSISEADPWRVVGRSTS